MKFVYLIFFLLVAWLLVDEFILQDRSSEGLSSYWDKLRDLGKRFHFIFGVLAVLALLMLAVRLALRLFLPK